MIQGKLIGIVVLTITFVCMSLLIIYFNKANIPNSPGYYSYNKMSSPTISPTHMGPNTVIEVSKNESSNINVDEASKINVDEVSNSLFGDVITNSGAGTDVVANSSSWVQLSEEDLGKIIERGPDPAGILEPEYSAQLDREQYVYEKKPDYNAIFMVADQPGSKYYGIFSSEDECASSCQNDYKFCAAYAWNPEIGTNQCFGRDNRHASMMPHRGIRSGVRKYIIPSTDNDYLIWPNYNATFEMNPITNSEVKYYGKQSSVDACLAQCKNDQQFCKAFSWNYDNDCYGRTDKFPNMALQNGYTSGVFTARIQ